MDIVSLMVNFFNHSIIELILLLLKVGMKDRAKLFGDKGFEAMFTGTKDENMRKLGEMIARYKKDIDDKAQD